MSDQRFNTGNPIGSDSPLDRSDNTRNLDVLTNSREALSNPDRFGVQRKTWYGMEREHDAAQSSRDDQFQSAQSSRDGQFQSAQSSREAVFSNFLQASGYQDLGEYEPGIEITAHNQYVTFGGQPYLLKPSIPVPYTTSGEWTGDDFKLIGDGSIRQDLANPDMGAAMAARGVVAVADKAALRSLPASSRRGDLLFIVKEGFAGIGSGGGNFYWNNSDASFLSIQDPLQGYVITPEGEDGSRGAWLRVMGPQNIDITSFIDSRDTPLDGALQGMVQAMGFFGGTTLTFPEGEYGVLRSAVIHGARGISLVGPAATIKRIAPYPSTQQSNVIELLSCSNMVVNLGVIDGGGAVFPRVEAQVHNLALYGCRGVSIIGLDTVESLCDGVYIAAFNGNRHGYVSDGYQLCEDISLSRVRALYSYRQGMSIIAARGVSSHICVFSFTGRGNGGATAPSAGVDLEANGAYPRSPVDISFDNCVFSYNAGSGLISTLHSRNLRISNCQFFGNATGAISSSTDGGIYENLIIRGNGKGALTGEPRQRPAITIGSGTSPSVGTHMSMTTIRNVSIFGGEEFSAGISIATNAWVEAENIQIERVNNYGINLTDSGGDDTIVGGVRLTKIRIKDVIDTGGATSAFINADANNNRIDLREITLIRSDDVAGQVTIGVGMGSQGPNIYELYGLRLHGDFSTTVSYPGDVRDLEPVYVNDVLDMPASKIGVWEVPDQSIAPGATVSATVSFGGGSNTNIGKQINIRHNVSAANLIISAVPNSSGARVTIYNSSPTTSASLAGVSIYASQYNNLGHLHQ